MEKISKSRSCGIYCIRKILVFAVAPALAIIAFLAGIFICFTALRRIHLSLKILSPIVTGAITFIASEVLAFFATWFCIKLKGGAQFAKLENAKSPEEKRKTKLGPIDPSLF